MDLELTKEQKMLRTTARDFLKKECPPGMMRDMKHDEKGYPESLWCKMAELGWLGILIPEIYGGVGGDFVDLALILEAMGEVCCPGPFFSSIVLGGLSILDGGSEEQKKMLLPKLAAGELIFAPAFMEPGSWYDLSVVKATAEAKKECFIINGTKLFAENAHIADYIICAARTGSQSPSREGISLFLIDAKSKGITCEVPDTLAYEKQCSVVFDNVQVPRENIIGEPGNGIVLLETIQEKAAVAKCAEMAGCIQKTFDMTVAYAKERRQFGRPIGAFQAIQHHCANMVIDVDGSRFLTYKAAWKIAHGFPAGMDASMAKAWAGEASRRVTFLGHQIHGAISFCDEHDMHLYYRKAKAGSVAYGDGDYHLEKITQYLGL